MCSWSFRGKRKGRRDQDLNFKNSKALYQDLGPEEGAQTIANQPVSGKDDLV
jgi:hypothetical protein